MLIAAKTMPGARIFAKAKDDAYPEWTGIIVGVDTEAEHVYLAWETREFSEQHIEKVAYVMPSNTSGTIEGGETAALEGAVVARAVVRYTQTRDPTAKNPIRPEDALTDPIMLRENAANIFVPNWKELPRMKHRTLRSAYESSMWGALVLLQPQVP